MKVYHFVFNGRYVLSAIVEVSVRMFSDFVGGRVLSFALVWALGLQQIMPSSNHLRSLVGFIFGDPEFNSTILRKKSTSNRFKCSFRLLLKWSAFDLSSRLL